MSAPIPPQAARFWRAIGAAEDGLRQFTAFQAVKNGAASSRPEPMNWRKLAQLAHPKEP